MVKLPSRGAMLLGAAGFGAALLCVGVGALCVVEGGLFDATATTPHNPLVAVATHTAFVRSVQRRSAAIREPAGYTAGQVVLGLRDYDASCSGCHGAPGIARAAFADGMTPPPPYLSDAARHWRPRQLYWIIARGVKMTGMPAWAPRRNDAQIWNIVAFLEAAPYLAPKDYARIRGPGRGTDGPGGASPLSAR